MKSLGQTAYEAYCEKTGGVSLVSGANLPTWEGVREDIRQAWEASAAAVAGSTPKEDARSNDTIPVVDIAEVCHEVYRAYGNRMLGDDYRSWEEAPEWQRELSIKGVQFLIDRPEAGPEACHDSWRATREADGWQWGRVLDTEKKVHPCMVSFIELPEVMQAKEIIFHAIVRSLLR